MQFYHDLSSLGLNVTQRPSSHAINQAAKEPILTEYMRRAFSDIIASDRPVTFAELFCADAYYSFLARRMGAERCDAFDDDSQGHFSGAEAINTMLGETGVTLHRTTVIDIPTDFRASVVLNAGGLYHVADPLAHLDHSYRMANDYLIVQTVITLATEDPDYIEVPAPGWTWGSRASYGFFQRAIEQRNWNLIDTTRNILTGNDRPEDRGSAYFLIAKQ